jgi:hypothetical protein
VAWRRRSLDALDKLLELALPPFSLLALGSVLLLVIQGMLAWFGRQSMTGVAFSVALALVAACFPFAGLAATGAPRAAYRALLAGPVYILWRAWISLRVRLRPRSIAWVRTRRTGDTKS